MTKTGDDFLFKIMSKAPSLIFEWNAEGQILPNQSKLALSLLNNGEDITGFRISDLLKEYGGVFDQINELAFTGQMDLEDLLELAPDILELQSRFFGVEYHGNYEDDTLISIILFGTDITKLQRLISATEKNLWFNKMCLEIIKERNIFNTYFNESIKGINEAVEIINSEKLGANEIEKLFRIVHSVKGSGASFYLKPLISVAHKLEHQLDEDRKKRIIENPVQVRTDLITIEKILLDINTEIVNLAGEYSEKIRTIDDDEIIQIEESLLKSDHPKIKQILDDLSKQHLKCYLENKTQSVFSSTMQQISQKSIHLKLDIQSIRVDAKIIDALDMSLPHLIRNSMDHGIETVIERKSVSKPFHGTLTLKVSKLDQTCLISLSDDGKGIDPDIIGKIAIEKQVLSKAELDKLNISEKQELIFAPGFSTAEEVSEISGRGVGMDSVKVKIESINGTLELKSEVGKGTEFKISIPLI